MGTEVYVTGEWTVNLITDDNIDEIARLVDEMEASVSRHAWMEAAKTGKLVITERNEYSSFHDSVEILKQLAQWSEPGSYLQFEYEAGAGWPPDMYWVDEDRQLNICGGVMTFPEYDRWKEGHWTIGV